MSEARYEYGVVIIEGHVQGLANARLLKKDGIPAIVVDKGNCIARYSRYCSRFFKCPDYLSEDFSQFLIDMNMKNNLKDWLLLPSNDHAVLSIAKHKTELSRYYKIITEDLPIIKKIYDKRTLLTIAESAGIPIPSTIMPIAENPSSVALRYPILIKGNNGLSFYKRFKNKAFLIKRESDLVPLWENELKGVKPHEYFIQEVIPDDNKTVSVTVFAERGTVHTCWMGIKLREHPISFGTATCCQSTHDKEMLDLSKNLIQQLKFTGVCEIEWIRDSRDDKPKLIEINARTWLWVGLAAKCGINYPKIIYDYVYNNSIPSDSGYRQNVIWLNLYTDLVFSAKRIISGIEKPMTLVRTYRRFTEACWDWKDPAPFFMYALLITKFIRQR